MPHDEDEVFVDIGAYDGLSTKQFIKWCDGCYKQIYMLEPSKELALQCEGNFVKYGNVTVYNCAAGEKNYVGTLFHRDDGMYSASHGDEEGDKICFVKLDDYLQDENVTFLKLDIEGGEMAALHGAKEIIKKYKPKVAVAVYHKKEDIIDIPKLLLSYNSDYKFYLRHYSIGMPETVLYAM
ncbi:MAG: FkbM family methyltransferase [Anaerovibrio sp.]